MKRIPILLLCLTFACSAPAQGSLEIAEAGAHSLESQVGQLILTGFAGTAPADLTALQARAEAGQITGIILHSYNIQNPTQLRALTDFVHSWKVPQPLIVAIDDEGGRVQRLLPSKGFLDIPAAADVAQMPPVQAWETYRALARQLADMGINYNFGPVVDLNVNPACPIIGAMGRSFGTDPTEVVRLAHMFISAHHEFGIQTALKHFPGHGSSTVDSHAGLPDITDTWSDKELAPFDTLLRAGAADSVMSAHLMQRHLDPYLPLSLSPVMLTGYLRQEKGYQGVIISDDLQMGAISQHYTFEQTVELALQAGTDMLLFSQNAAAYGSNGFQPIDHLTERIVTIVRDALASGRLTQAQLDASYARIHIFKSSL